MTATIESKVPGHVKRLVKQMMKHQPHVLGQGEQILSASTVVTVSTPQLSQLANQVGLVGALIGKPFAQKAVDKRVDQICAHLNVPELPFVPEVPKSGMWRSGYCDIAMTNLRLLVISANGKQLLAEAPLAGADVQILKHERSLRSLIFTPAGAQALIFTNRLDAPKKTDHIIDLLLNHHSICEIQSSAL
jgi:hypothetical protein